MTRLLVADLHLDDAPANEYRWTIFDRIHEAMAQHLYILGDLCHKKDRYSALLVNRLVHELAALLYSGTEVTILRGNHDTPLKGPAYFEFLNDLADIKFVTEPMEDIGALLLPHSPDPVTDWANIDFAQYQCILMHQPVSGMDLGTGHKITVPNMVKFPPGIPVYSGDAHYPQNINGVEYIGTPHPINFGENHLHRMIVLDWAWHFKKQIVLVPPRKLSIVAQSIEDLQAHNVQAGDQAKIEFIIPASKVDQWPIEQAAISEWAKAHGVAVSAVKAVVETSPDNTEVPTGFMQPLDVLINFADAEGIEDALLTTGYNLLEEALASGA